MSFTSMDDVPNPIFDANGDPFSGAVLKAYLPGTTTSTSIFIDSAGSSPQATITANAKGIWEVSGNEIIPYIDRECKWGIFLDAADATNNAPFYMGPFDDVAQTVSAGDHSGNDIRYSAVFGSAAEMVALTPIDGVTYVPVSGQLVQTASYYSSIPFTEPQGGGGDYRVMTLAEYALTPDEAGAAFTVGGFAFVRQGEVKSTQDFGAKEDGVTYDDTTAIQAALDSAFALNETVVKSFGRPRITAPVNVPSGVTWDLNNPAAQGSVYRSGSGWEQVTNGELVVDFGSGVGTLSQSAVQLNYRSGFMNASVWYPGQNPDAATPTEFPPSIHALVNVETPVISSVNFVNSYIAVDVTLLHSNLKINNLTGFPLFRGVKIGQTNGFETLENVNFSSGFAYRTPPPQSTWMVNNAIVLELFYSTWATYVNWKCFGYQKLVFSDTGPYAPTAPGAAQRSTFIGCMADNTPYGFHFIGSTAGLSFIGCIAQPTNALDPTILDGWGFKYDPTLPTASGNSDVSFSNCRVFNASADAFIIVNAKGYNLTDCYVATFGIDVAADAVRVINSSNGSIRGGFIDGDASLANSNGVTFDATCSKMSVTEVNFLDFNSTGHKQLHLASGAVEYTIKNNHFNDAAAGLIGIVDDSGDNRSIITDNQDDKQVTSITDSEVSAGILQLPVDIDILTYAGTTALTGVADTRDGRTFTIIFSNVVALTSGANFVLLGGSRNSTAFVPVTFRCTTTAAWEI